MKEQKQFDLIGLGEVMIRLSPVGKSRLSQSDTFEKQVGGSELNIVAGASLMGLRTGLVSKLPDSVVGEYVFNKIRQFGVSDQFVARDRADSARVGLYYYESGAFPRKSGVVYDRKHSSFTTLTRAEIPDEVYASAEMVHTCGITLALSPQICDLTAQMIRRFKDHGAKISFDVNYRANLWDEQTAKKAITAILPMVDILFISEETSRRMFAKTGTVEQIMKEFSEEYGLSVVATSERKVLSPTRHTFGSVLYSREEDRFFTEPPYENIEVVDRIGSGDAYVSGVLSGLSLFGDYQKALQMGNACAALKNTIPGDLPFTSLREIEKVIQSHQGTGSADEMNR